MIKKLTYPFRLAITEFKKDNAFRKAVQSKTIKSTILGFMVQSCIFLLIIFSIYLYLVYTIIVTIFLLQPVGLIVFPVFLLMLLFFISIYKKKFPKTKINYLKHKNVYEKYQEVTQQIE